MPSKEEAQEMFDRLMDFGTNNQDIPMDVLEALDYVANYCGDIAKGRKYTPPHTTLPKQSLKEDK